MKNFLENYFQLIKRFMPSKAPESSVGLDIGTSECKLIELMKSNDAFEVLTWAIEPIESGNAAQSVQRALARITIPNKFPCTSISGKGTLIRYINMPRMPLVDLRKSFAIEADKYFPFPSDQIYTDCCILDPLGKSREMAVMGAAVKKELVDQRIKFFTDLGLQANFIGIDAVALSNVFNTFQAGQSTGDQVVALLDMGTDVSSLTIYSDRIPELTRDIFIGGNDFTKKISNTLGISVEEAEQLKRAPDQRLNELLTACSTTSKSLVQELRLSFDYFATEKNKEVKSLFLTGGGSALQGIHEILAKDLDVQVAPWNCSGALKMSQEIIVADFEKNIYKLNVALGLALYNYV